MCQVRNTTVRRYSVEVYDFVDYSKSWYTVTARSHTEAQYKMCTYLLQNTDMTFEDFEITQVKMKDRR